MHFKIGTRSSALAVWQAQYIADQLVAGGHSIELVLFETQGDKKLEVAIAKIGSKGVFTQELEDSLLKREIDIAVHSAKDLTSELPEGLELIAFSEREEVCDVVVSYNPDFQLGTCPTGTVVGSSSTRRRAMLQRHYSQLVLTEIRGNLQTRFRKLKEGAAEAMILAYAGVKRMGYDDLVVTKLPLTTFIPPAGQGAIAIEIASHLDTDRKAALRELCNDNSTELCVLAERAYLAKLQGGCSIPVFAHAYQSGRYIFLKAGITSLDGREVLISQEQALANFDASIELGKTVGQQIINKGGDQILKAIRQAQS